ncbi:MAG: BsuPI-related putative proteinase inhibitor [Bryobacteraceae bacterium]
MVRRTPSFKLFRVFTLMALAASAGFAQTEYFPLEAGNQWIYRSSFNAEDVRVVSVDEKRIIDGREYSLVRGWFGGDSLLRMDSNGTLYAYDSAAKSESLWIAFATPEGGSFETALDPCNRRGIVTARKAQHKGAVGQISETLQIRYPATNCADAGLDGDVWAPYIGLVERTFVTIAGPRIYRLIYSRTGGVTVLSEPELSFGLTLDKSAYTEGQLPVARLTLRHSQPEPLPLTFPSTQTYDLAIRNEKGEILYNWSAGKSFAQLFREERLAAGEKNWVISVSIPVPAVVGARPLQPGVYTAEAWLTTSGPRRYVASVGFEVK